jgi:hypothetical protein
MPENDKVIDMATGEVARFLCHICGFNVPEPDRGCPNFVNHPAHQELPPLGVCVSDVSGVTGKVGG